MASCLWVRRQRTARLRCRSCVWAPPECWLTRFTLSKATRLFAFLRFSTGPRCTEGPVRIGKQTPHGSRGTRTRVILNFEAQLDNGSTATHLARARGSPPRQIHHCQGYKLVDAVRPSKSPDAFLMQRKRSEAVHMDCPGASRCWRQPHKTRDCASLSSGKRSPHQL